MTKRIFSKKRVSQAGYRENRSTNNRRFNRALIPLLVPMLSSPVIIFGCLALANTFFLWKLRRRQNISDVVLFNILGGCLAYLTLGFLVYVNSERAESERILSFIYLNFSQEQGLLAFLAAFSIILLIPLIVSFLVIKKRNYINHKIRDRQEQQRIRAEQEQEAQRLQEEYQKLREKQEKQRIKAEKEAQRAQEEYNKKLSEVFVSTTREDYIISKKDYKRGNKIEREYRKKYVLRLLSLYQNQCAKCGRSDNGFEIDHFFISKNEGGNFSLIHKDGHFINNAIPLCRSCNSSKSDRSHSTFFNDKEILTLFTKNREMTLLLNQVSSSDQLQLEIQGLLPGEPQLLIAIDEDKNVDLTESQISLSEPEQLVSQLSLSEPIQTVDPEPKQSVSQHALDQNYNPEKLLDDKTPESDENTLGLSNDEIPQFITSQYGFRTNFWSDQIIRKKWDEFTQAGLEYAMPIKRIACTSPFLDSPGTLYAALYPKEKFDNLAHFQIYSLFSSSIQQALIQTGEVDMYWFYEKEEDEGVEEFNRWDKAVMEFPEEPSIQECLAQVGLPETVHWVKDLHFHAWAFERREEIFEVQADCLEGYLTMFTVDD